MGVGCRGLQTHLFTLVKTCLVTYYVNHIFSIGDGACSACVMINREGIRGVKLIMRGRLTIFVLGILFRNNTHSYSIHISFNFLKIC